MSGFRLYPLNLIRTILECKFNWLHRIIKSKRAIWLEPYWNVNACITGGLFETTVIWLEPYWNVNIRYCCQEWDREDNLIRTILECKSANGLYQDGVIAIWLEPYWNVNDGMYYELTLNGSFD